MRRHISILVTTSLVAVLGIVSVPLAGFTEARAQRVDQPLPAYNPYPPGILPPDLEIGVTSGPARGSNHLPTLCCRVASIATADSDGQPTNTFSDRIRGSTNIRWPA